MRTQPLTGGHAEFLLSPDQWKPVFLLNLINGGITSGSSLNP